MNKKYFFVGIIIALLGLGIFYWNHQAQNNNTNFSQALNDKTNEASVKKFIEIENPSGFVNTEKITIGENIGKKVILVDILTYSCINCIRTFPYLNAWYDKYKDDGLEIIGIHTPEFAFEHKKENVAEAMQKFGIKFPIVLDNDYSTWRAYKNNYWPHKYLIDINGNIVYDHIGEGGYDETEKKIQELLEERKQHLGLNHTIETDMAKPTGTQEVSAGVKSPEIYFGAARNAGLGNGEIQVGKVQTFTAPKSVKLNTLYLTGSWNFSDEFVENKSKNAKITFRYSAQRIFFVASSETENTVRISQDGKFVKEVKIQADQLYTLMENELAGEHTIEIEIPEAGLKAFTFTFG